MTKQGRKYYYHVASNCMLHPVDNLILTLNLACQMLLFQHNPVFATAHVSRGMRLLPICKADLLPYFKVVTAIDYLLSAYTTLF